MNRTINLKNSELSVNISTLGAEIQSIKAKGGTDFIWNGDAKFWTGRAPLLFPICSSLNNDTFKYNGSEYKLKKHGFAKYLEFEIEKEEDGSAEFLFVSNEETYKNYPFLFELRVFYKLNSNKLEIKYEVKNKTDGEMYFSIGSHEAYACPDGIENYTVCFDGFDFPLKNYYFLEDALIMHNIKFNEVTLKHNLSSKTVKLKFDGCKYFLLWTAHNAPYICLEPWTGIFDPKDFSGEISEKEGITKLVKGEIYEKNHTISFFE